jgi:hypothetical protein
MCCGGSRVHFAADRIGHDLRIFRLFGRRAFEGNSPGNRTCGCNSRSSHQAGQYREGLSQFHIILFGFMVEKLEKRLSVLLLQSKVVHSSLI